MHAVSHTARWTAALRARESDRPDRLFSDPLARTLAGDEGFTMLKYSEQQQRPGGDVAPYIVVRTRFFDDLALRVAGAGVRQVVIVAAGMDARAFRLSWAAGTAVYELDQPELLHVKDEILSREGARACCRRIPLGVNLEQEWGPALTAAGFICGEPSLWLAEGLFFYLEERAVQDVIGQISDLAAEGSSLGADFVGQSFLTSPWTREALRSIEQRGMGWRFGTDDPEALLARYGWQAEATQPGEEAASYGRWPYPVVPRGQREYPHSYLVIAHRA